MAYNTNPGEKDIAMNTKHTPGPWKCNEAKNQNGEATISISAEREFLCTMDTVSSNGGPYVLPPSGEANAKLIAAAPDLLAALKTITLEARGLFTDSQAPYYTISEDNMNTIREAIAKATS